MTERGVAVVQAARDLDVAESVLRRWMRDAVTDTGHAFRGRWLGSAQRWGSRARAVMPG